MSKAKLKNYQKTPATLSSALTKSSIAVLLIGGLLSSIQLGVVHARGEAKNKKKEPIIAQVNEPILIKSDSAEYEQTKGVVSHIGHVEMTQGPNKVSADMLSLEQDKSGQIQRVVAKGKPARFEVVLQNNKKITGKGNSLEYYPKTQIIVLEGKAELYKEQDSFKGPKVTFNLQTKQIESEKSKDERTTIIISPK